MSEVDWNEYFPSGIADAKRLGMCRPGWMGDWFTSYSPRNGNTTAEGPWAHWMQLALSILQHPATAEIRPEVHAAVKDLENTNHYDGGPTFDEDDVTRLFGGDSDD